MVVDPIGDTVLYQITAEERSSRIPKRIILMDTRCDQTFVLISISIRSSQSNRSAPMLLASGRYHIFAAHLRSLTQLGPLDGFLR